MDPTIKIKVAHYRDRSDELLQAMNFFLDDSVLRASVIGLLAVHSTIAMNDALTLAILEKRSSAKNHQRAEELLTKTCQQRQLGNNATAGTDRLHWLLGKKTLFSYGDQGLDPKMIEQAADKAQRFSAWAYENFREVLRDQS